jgi:hypothetical protein
MAIAAATDFDTTFDMRDPSRVRPYDCRGGSDGRPKKQSKLADGARELGMQNSECRIQN